MPEMVEGYTWNRTMGVTVKQIPQIKLVASPVRQAASRRLCPAVRVQRLPSPAQYTP